MGNILKFDVAGWNDLDITLNGEAVLNYNKDGCFILTKIRAQRAILSLSEFQEYLHSSLTNEVQTRLLCQKTFSYADTLWYVDLYSVNNPSVEYFHFCYTEKDGYYILLQSATNCIDSISILNENLEMLFDAIDFEPLLSESGLLENEHGNVRVYAISDIHLCVPENEMLFFVGKDNYVALCLRDSMCGNFTEQQNELIHNLNSSAFSADTSEFLVSNSCNRARYCIKRQGNVSGFICYEEKVLKAGVVLSSIAYSKSLDNATIEDYVRFEVVA